jgi:DNA-binding XRE family transcriptional regulator
MPLSQPLDVTAAWATLGRDLAQRRKQAGLTQETLAPHTLYGRSTIANVEAGRQRINRAFWQKCDDTLNTGGALAASYDRITRWTDAQRRTSLTADVAIAPHMAPTAPVQQRAWDRTGFLHPSVTVGATARPPLEHQVWVPPGRHLPGSAIPAQVHPAVLSDHVLVAVAEDYGDAPFVARPGRGLVIGRVDVSAALYAMDTRHVRRRLRGARGSVPLPIPRAYRLDDLTFAVLWAVANFDDALLADDGLIAESQIGLAEYAQLTNSSVSRDAAADMTPTGRMWLGSHFCAEHIRRHSSELTNIPVFWTREQRGEEAATWLVFTHKQAYLRELATRQDPATTMVRAFCIPRTAVDSSPTGERILLLLAIAVMESYGVHTVVTDTADYGATPGFVSDRQTRAITANWVGADGIWHVDVTDHRPTLREYGDATDHAMAHSVIAAPTPHGRLRALAAYLDLDWTWLADRCRELATTGSAGIAQPRSRHLSVDGVDRACSFLAAGNR